MIDADNLLHLIKQVAQEQIGDTKVVGWGHVANYDPKTHTVQVLLPAYTDSAGLPVVTGWMQLATPWASDATGGWGMQVSPSGNFSTVTNPTAGETVMVLLVERSNDAFICGMMMFNLSATPPKTDLNFGECIIQHKSGTYLYFDKSGNMNIHTNAKLNVTTSSDTVVNSSGDVSVSASGSTSISSTGNTTITGALVKLGGGSTPVARTGDVAGPYPIVTTQVVTLA